MAGRRKVGVRIKAEIREINDVRESVEIDLWVVLHFDHAIEHNTSQISKVPYERIDLAAHGIDLLTAELLGTKTCEMLSEVNLRSMKTGMIFNIKQYRILLPVPFDLHRFPFDRQLIKLKLSSFRNDFVKWYSPIDDTPFRIRNDELWRDTDVLMVSDNNSWNLDRIHTKISQADVQSMLSITLGISRRPNYYLTNFVFVIFIIVQAGCSFIAIPYNDFGARSSLILTLLLTIIAFKFVMASYLPVVSYQTYLDRYSVLSIILIASIILENFIIAYVEFSDPSAADKIDTIFTLTVTSFWVLVHVIICTCALFPQVLHEPWEHVMKEDKDDMETHQHVSGLIDDGHKIALHLEK